MKDPVEPALPREISRIGDAARRPGFQLLLGMLSCEIQRHHAAAALQDQRRAGEVMRAQPVLEVVEIFGHHRHQCRAYRGGDEAAMFAEHRLRLRRQQDVDVGTDLAEDLAHPLLVRAVGIGIDETDADRFQAFCGDGACDLSRLILVERPVDLTAGIHPLGDREPEASPDDRTGLGLIRIVEMLAMLTTDLDRVAETFGRDETRIGIAALDQRVGARRGAVHQIGYVRDRDPRLPDRLQHADRPVGARRQHLRRLLLPGVFLPRKKIGERPAYINPDSPHLTLPPFLQS